MNLLPHLLLRIIAVVLLCLLATASYLLHDSDQAAQQASLRMADSLSKQLSVQPLRMGTGFGAEMPFPDFSLWKQTNHAPGVCVDFVAADSNKSYSLCNGEDMVDGEVPSGFANVYRWFFKPGLTITKTLHYNNKDYGVLSVTPSTDLEIAGAWDNIRRLLGLSACTVAAVGCLVYLSIRRALRPAQTIVAGLGCLAQGQLAYRLPPFTLGEWQRIADAINQLAASQQQLLDERQTLAVQLMNLQEEERRYLARELHDEFGQCLAAINAIAAAIAQTASQQCPELLAETRQIGQISQHMLENVRGLLVRLRPAELEELGLATSLETLIGSWNAHGGKTRYRLCLSGANVPLPTPLAVTVFRIVQECLTNIAKHALADQAEVNLAISPKTVTLQISDDGITTHLPFAKHTGIGLLGIRERVMALQGRLALSVADPQGLRVDVCLPVPAAIGDTP